MKCVHSDTKIKVDLIVDSKDDSTRFRCSHLLYHYGIGDWRFRPLLIAVKLWAQKLDINDPVDHSLSSHSLTIMVIHYLVAGRPTSVVEDLIKKYPNKFSPKLSVDNLKFDALNLNVEELRCSQATKYQESLSELFLGFLSYFGSFDYNKYGITISGRYNRLDPKLQVTRDFSTKMQHFLVQDPFDHKNAARAISSENDLDRVRRAFSSSIAVKDKETDFDHFCLQAIVNKSNIITNECNSKMI